MRTIDGWMISFNTISNSFFPFSFYSVIANVFNSYIHSKWIEGDGIKSNEIEINLYR